MAEQICSSCGRSKKVLSPKGLCWTCYNAKEKMLFKTIVNDRTILLIYSSLLTLFFMLNAIPTIRLGSLFTKNYSVIENAYIRNGKDYLFLSIYLILKISFAISIMKSCYTKIGSRILNLIPELILFITKSIIVSNYITHKEVWETRLSPITDALHTITEDTLSSEYIAFFICFFFGFLVLRLIASILAYILNAFLEKYFKEFYQHSSIRKQVNELAHWEFYLRHHPEYFKQTQTPFVAAQSPAALTLTKEFLEGDLSCYQMNTCEKDRLITLLLSEETYLLMNYNEQDLYFTYIKDKLSQWKDNNASQETFLTQDVMKDFSTKYNYVRDCYHTLNIEGRTYFILTNQYTQNYEYPMNELTDEKHAIKLSIDQLYAAHDLYYRKMKVKEKINAALALLDRQAINLMDISIEVDDTIIDCDNIVISNRGIFIIDVYIDDASRTEQLMRSQSHVLLLEKLVNEVLGNPLDHYLELYSLAVNGNAEDAVPYIIQPEELLQIVRSHPVIFDEAFMNQLKELFISQEVESSLHQVPNYRKLIIDSLEDQLERKISLLTDNSELMTQVDKTYAYLTKKHFTSFLPLFM